MSFATAAAIFNSCNKSGSIRELTKHLDKHPDDYNGLMLRARASNIVGKREDALRDIEHAISVSEGVKKEIAIARYILVFGNKGEYGAQTKRTVTKYPDDWKARMELGDFFTSVGNHEEATPCYMESLNLATKYKVRDHEVCWLNFYVGNSWMEKGDVQTAKRYYEAAIQSSPKHTVSHIQLCKCNIAQGDVPAARLHFQKAKSLNPKLAFDEFHTKSFDEYFARTGVLYTSVSSSAAGIQEGRAEGGATGGLGGGNDSSNGDGGNDRGNDDDKDGGDKGKFWSQLSYFSIQSVLI